MPENIGLVVLQLIPFQYKTVNFFKWLTFFEPLT